MMTDRRTTLIDATPDDKHRLALLWRAFEDAEERIRELEREADERNRASHPAAAPAPDALARIEAAAARRHDALMASIRRLEDELHASSRERDETREALDAARAELETTRAAMAASKAAAEAESQRYALAQGVIRHEQAKRAEAEREVELHRSRAAVLDEALAEERALVNEGKIEAERARAAIEERVVDLIVREDAANDRQRATLREVTRLEAELRAAHAELDAAVRAREAIATQMAGMGRRVARARPAQLFPVEATPTSGIPTIQPDEVAALRAAGVNFADPLLYEDITDLAAATGIGAPRIWKLRALAEIMSLHGIGHEWAERLFRAGVRSIEEIACMDASELEARLWVTYDEDAISADARVLLERTLPARCESVVTHAREALLRGMR